jgi:transglutaminase-like putative cysteine protease
VRTTTEGALCAVAASAGGLLYARYFESDGYLLPLVVAAFGGALIVVVAALRRWRLLVTSLLSIAGFAVAAVYLVFPGTVEFGLPTARSGDAMFWGLVGGWMRMFTVGMPADVRGELLITPFAITWLAVAMAAVLAVRSRAALLPAAPLLVAFVVGLIVVGNQGGVQLLPTVVFLGAVLLLTLVRSARGSSLRIGSALGFDLPVLALITALGICGGVLLPLAHGVQRFDPRSLSEPPVVIADSISPLARVKRQLRQEPPAPLFTVTVHSGAQLDRIRTAALTEFDGTLWTSRDRFVLAGQKLNGQVSIGQTVDAHVEIDQLGGQFLPEFGDPARVRVTSRDWGTIGYCRESGVLVSADPQLRGLVYDVTGSISVRDGTLMAVSPGRIEAVQPDPPDALYALARRITEPESQPYGKLVALENYVRGIPYTIDSEPGHSYAALTRFLTGTGELDARGYAEQHAAAFATLARAAGFPVRVAVGYRLHDDVAGRYQVTSKDAHAWAEVLFEGRGWVQFEPTDFTRTSSEPSKKPESPQVVGPPQPDPPVTVPPVPPPASDPHGRTGIGFGDILRATAVTLVVLVSVVIVAAVLTALEKARRRWRRRRGDYAARVLGAWREILDRMVERGVRVPVTLTPREVAGRLGIAADLAPLVTMAVYAPDQLTEVSAHTAWDTEADLRRTLYPRRLSLQWLVARLDPRSLFAEARERRQTRAAMRQLGVR